MSSHSETELRRWIQEVAATSEPIELNEVLDWPPVDFDSSSSTDVTSLVPLELAEPVKERPMNSKRAAIVLAAAAIIAVVAFAVTGGDVSNGNEVAAEGDEPTTTAPADEQATVIAPLQTPAQMATAYWQAVAAGDVEATLGLIDPTALDSGGAVPFGRAATFEGTFDWYEAVDWQWRLDECVDDNGDARCSVSAGNAWSEALGVEPVTGVFIVRFGENGIIEVEDQVDNFVAQWSTQVFEVFARWVQDNHPDDAAVMFDFNVDVNPEILSLYELNTARFVEAQQTG